MTERYQRVEPTPFDAAPPPGAQARTPADGEASLARLAVPGLALLIVAALFVFLLLPGIIDERGDATAPAAPQAPPAGASTETGSARTAPDASADRQEQTPAASPYADALEARARAEAQDLLSELIDVRENLEARGALTWAAEVMDTIAAEATAGDERYRERAFDEAIGHYRAALDQALALEGSLETRFRDQLDRVDAAIEDFDAGAAAGALELAALIEPGAPELASRQERLEALPAVQQAAEAARAAEDAGDLAGAVTALRGASELDPDHAVVAAELARLEAALRDQRFNAAMSEGYAALDGKDFGRAEARFRDADRLRPGAAEAAAALQELAVARTAARLAGLRERGAALIAEEDWDAAVTVFEEALGIDGSLRFAREGLARARPRAVLDKALQAIIEAPERLVDDAILGEARATLQEARGVAAPGARLSGQLARVSEIIEIASTPLPVTLRSDGETEVIVYKVARLGRFETRELELRPGEYTAVGSRRGYRDVRVVFTVTPERDEPVVIACSEPI